MRTIFTLCILTAVLLVSGCMMPDRKEQVSKNEAKLAEEGYTVLEPGSDSAPAVDVIAVDGTTLVAGGAPPARPLLLYFVTAPDTPNSAKEVHQLNRAAAELSTAGVTAAIVLPATPARASDYRAEHCPDLPVVADADLTVSIPYGCAINGVEYLQRTEIGIAADGTVVFFERGFPLNSPKLILEAFGIATIED